MGIKIVILGGGFGGVATYQALKKYLNQAEAEITLVSATNFFLFAPLLHEVAVGTLPASSIIVPLPSIVSTDTFICASVTAINFDQKTINLTSKVQLSYDYLVLATGATTSYFGLIPPKNCYALKTLDDALAINRAVIKIFADIKPASVHSIAVVGGGPTGVELSCELHDLVFNRLLKKVPVANKPTVNLYLVTKANTILETFSHQLQTYTQYYLKKLAINVITSTEITSLETGELQLGPHTKLKPDIIIWTTGVQSNKLPISPQHLPQAVSPTEYLNLACYQTVFVVGDQNPNYPKLAQVAVSQASYVAKNITSLIHNRPLTPFRVNLNGMLLSLGHMHAAGEMYLGPVTFRIYGRLGWFIWRTIYLSKMPTLKKKVLVASRWTYNLFTKLW